MDEPEDVPPEVLPVEVDDDPDVEVLELLDVLLVISALVFIACPISCILILMTIPTNTKVKNTFKNISIPVLLYLFVILNGQQAIKKGIRAQTKPNVTTASTR